VNAGHGRKEITEAVSRQIAELDYAPPFQMGHPPAFELANEVVRWLPDGLDHVFFTNSGSESVDTALKIALAYHRVRGEGTRTRFIGRERGYHGVASRHLRGRHGQQSQVLRHAAAGRGPPAPHARPRAQRLHARRTEWGAHLADDLERIVALHDASNIAAVIVEPVAGSTGVLIPPKGYSNACATSARSTASC